MRLGRWDALRLALPGEVDVDATIADPRLRSSGRNRQPFARWTGVGRAAVPHGVAVRVPAAAAPQPARLAG